MPENVCPQCKAPNRNSARYCAECGTPLLSDLPPVEAQPERPLDERATQSIGATGRVGGILIGRYRLDYELGRGGFGAVYKGYDINLSRTCAIKENLEVTLDAQRQFAREASVLANLSHSNLPRVTDHFSIPNQGQYLVMDFVEGQDLASIVASQGAIAYEQAAAWTLQVADALDYLHTQPQPVIHRDVKPANIRVTSRGKAYLVDFGLVKLSVPGGQTTLGARAITPGYAPPEQYGRGKTDPRTDIYALGATLYNLLTGDEPLESVQRVTGDSHPTVHQRNPAVPQIISQVVERAMALDPQARFQSMAELRAALQTALQMAASAPTGVEPSLEVFQNPTAIGVKVDPALKSVDLRAPRPQAAAAPSQARPASQPPRPASKPRAGSQPLPAPRRGAASYALIGGLILLCLGGGYLATQLAGGTSSASATATVQAQATLGARLQATASAQAELIQARQTAAADLAAAKPALSIPGLPDWPVRAVDAFNTNLNGWWVGQETNSAVFNRLAVQIENGLYQVSLDPKGANNLWMNRSLSFQTGENFILSADSRQTGGPGDAWRGLIFRQTDPKNYYLFAIADQGKYGLWRYKQGEWGEIVQAAATGIRAGEMAHLSVYGQGQEFTFYVNGQKVDQQTLADFGSGAAGLYFEAVSPQIVSFETDNLMLQAP